MSTPEYRREWYAKNRTRALDYQREFRLRHPKRELVKSARRRKGVPCTITEHDFEIPAVCPLLGIPLVHARGSLGAHDGSPSLDRIDPSKGYVPGNVWVISYKANSMKRDATPAELVTFARAILQHFDKEEPDT